MSTEPYDKFERIFDAQFPRFNTNATIPPNSNELKIVCDHYKLRKPHVSSTRKPINLFFLHGTGMNKSVWNYYAEKLFEISESNTSKDSPAWQINNIISMDLITHGESAIYNFGKLGNDYDWRDGGRDLVKIVSELNFEGDNIAIGHSMGGFQVIYAASIAPALFKYVVPVEAVMNQPGDAKVLFTKLLTALNRAIVTEFKNEAQYEKYMRTKSFYVNFHPKILEDFIKSEKWVRADGTVCAKSTKEHQMLGYYAGFFTFPIAVEVARSVNIPIVHIVGANGTWNDKECVEILRKEVRFLDAVDIKDGQHLVNGEQPDDVIETLVNSFNKYIKPDEESAFKQRPSLDLDGYQKAFREGYSKIEAEYFLKKPTPEKL